MSYKLKKYNHTSFLMVCIFFRILHPTMGNYLIIDKRTNCLLYKGELQFAPTLVTLIFVKPSI